MNEIKDYICQTSCKIVVNKLQKVLTYITCRQMDEKPCWHFICHIGILFTTLECAWEYNVEISCKKVAYSYIVYTILYTT
jgi:hypothetical protein